MQLAGVGRGVRQDRTTKKSPTEKYVKKIRMRDRKASFLGGEPPENRVHVKKFQNRIFTTFYFSLDFSCFRLPFVA
jgi:hypothetical protein